MKLITLFALSLTLAACAADGTDDVETTVAPSPMTASTFNTGGGTGTTKQSDLEANGYTCSHLDGTTLTLCWKNGGGSYTCDANGNCIASLTTTPTKTYYPLAPISTAVLAK